jgi:hypothetical protein
MLIFSVKKVHCAFIFNNFKHLTKILLLQFFHGQMNISLLFYNNFNVYSQNVNIFVSDPQ